MNLPQAKTYLEKIITLYKTMTTDAQNISSIERDLMLSYIRQLYETFQDDAAAPPPSKSVRPAPIFATPEPPAARPKPEPAVSQEPVAPPVNRAAPTPEPVAAPVYRPAPEPERPAYSPPPVEHAPYAPPPVAEAPKYTPPEPVKRPEPAPVKTAPVWNGSEGSEINALFEEAQSSGDISDRLAQSPIADLTKAFALNDKLLFINELFAGNATTLDQAVKYVNNLSSFGAAALYLKEFAARNQWTANESRKKQALAFIKMVRRRFK